MIRVCLLTSSFPRDGGDIAGAFIREMCLELTGRSFIFDVVAPAPGPQPSRGSAADWKTGRSSAGSAGITITRFSYFLPRRWQRLAHGAGIEENVRRNPLLRTQFPLFLLAFVNAALRKARVSDLIWSHWLAPAGLVGAIAARLSKRPHIVTIHSAPPPAAARLFRLFTGENVHLVAVSDSVRRRTSALTGVSEKEIRLIPMGARAPLPATPSPAALKKKYGLGSKFVILFMGRLIELKGVETLIEAGARIPGVLLVIAGEGPRRDQLRRLALSSGAHVRFEGFMSGEKKYEWLSLCDIFALPSLSMNGEREEGMPVTLLEALAAGRPVAASRSGGASEVIRDGVNGLLVAPGDAGALAGTLKALIDDPEARTRLGANARESAQAYRLEKVADQYEKLFVEAAR